MKYLILAISLFTISTQTSATPVTFTGAELADLPGATFPTGIQTIIGDDLRIDNTIGAGIIYRLPLDQFDINPENLSLSINYTRLLSDSGSNLQRLRLGVYDGQTLFNVFAFNPGGDTIRGQITEGFLSPDERNLLATDRFQLGPETPSPIGSIAQLNVLIQASPITTIITGDLNQSGAFSDAVNNILDRNNGLDLIISGDFVGENYLINSLTITSDASGPFAVPESGTLGGLAFGLTSLSLGLYRRRRR